MATIDHPFLQMYVTSPSCLISFANLKVVRVLLDYGCDPSEIEATELH